MRDGNGKRERQSRERMVILREARETKQKRPPSSQHERKGAQKRLSGKTSKCTIMIKGVNKG